MYSLSFILLFKRKRVKRKNKYNTCQVDCKHFIVKNCNQCKNIKLFMLKHLTTLCYSCIFVFILSWRILMNNVVEVDCNVGHGYKEWVVNTKDRWCSFILRKHYDAGVFLETGEDGDESYYLLKGFNKNKIPFFNQEKDQIIIVVIDGYEETI